MSYLSNILNVNATPQSEPIPGLTQVSNSAGGYAFAVDKWSQLRRFLILGAEGGSYYASEHALALANATSVLECIKDDGLRVVAELISISEGGHAPKNDPALFALALASRLGDEATRKAAFRALPRVARIGTHLFHFVAFMEQVGRWAALPRRGVATWYEDMPLPALAEQAIKYQARDGWSHADVLRLAHPRAHGSLEREALYRYMSYGVEPDCEHRGSKVKGHMPEVQFRDVLGSATDLRALHGAEAMKTAGSAAVAAQLIREYQLPREAVPTQFLDSADVWDALLPQMGITAVIRNLAKMTAIGLLKPGSPATAEVIRRLSDAEILRRGRVHPISILMALMTYKSGRGVKGSLTWEPVTAIVDTLDRAFYLAFETVEPSGAVWEMWLDISGSMDGGAVAGIPGFSPRVAAAAFSLVTTSVERQCEFYAFTTDTRKLSISPRQRLDDVIKEAVDLSRLMGRTDCAQPMLHALNAKRHVDVFCVLTDNETWAGTIHPIQALREYRAKVNSAAKLIVVGMVANRFSIADPSDASMLDVVGFDSAAPVVMSDFAAGRL